MNTAKPERESKSPKRRKRLRWAAGLLLFYTVFGFLILPRILRWVAVKQLSKQLDREVSIETIRLNPFALSTTIRGLLIKDKDGQPFVSWDEVYVNLELASCFGHPWVFKEISTSNTFARVQMNQDYSLNFSDLIAKFSPSPTNAPAAASPARPLAVRIERLHIARAAVSLADFTPSTPFKRLVGPLDITLDRFRTDPDNKNPYSFSGTTDGGETISWSGYFYLDPLRSAGEFALKNISLNKYAPLYQDFVRFQIRDGVVDLGTSYHFELSATNRVAIATNSSFALHSLKLAEPGSATNFLELPEFAVTGASGDAQTRHGEINLVSGSGGKLFLRRDGNAAINVVELSKPAATATNAPGGILFLLRSVTNVVAQLLDSTNAWTGVIQAVSFQDSALSLTDLVNSRPAALELDHISLTVTNISNLPGEGLHAALELRWNTNGTIRADVSASLQPLSADVQVTLDQVALRPLDPYLESQVNLFVEDGKLDFRGRAHLRTTNGALPQISFDGDAALQNFATVDGDFGEDLVKCGAVRISGIAANLTPLAVAVKEISVNDAYARIIIATNRTINLLSALRLVDTNAPETQIEKSESGKAKTKKKSAILPAVISNSERKTNSLPDIAIASVVISNAQIFFTDRSMNPDVNLSLQQAGGTIVGLSTRQLEHADINIHAKVDNVGPVEITGTIHPFDDRSTNTVTVTVRDVDLTPTSPYSGKFAGYRIAKGKLGLALAYHLQGRNLQSENKLTLDQFTFGEKVDSPDATKLPVRLGIAILKDRNGKIELDIPIEGSLDDPKFKIGKAVWHVIETLLVKVALSPFAALGAVFGGRGEELNYQDFAPGSLALSADGTNKLDLLVKGLYERPGLQLEIAGSVATDADRLGLRQVALDKQLRTEKWLSLGKTERSSTTPEQLLMTPEERSRLLKKIYARDVPKNSPTTKTNLIPIVRAAAPATRNVSQVGPMKGATLLMQRPGASTATPVSSAAASAPSPTPGSEPDIEQILQSRIPIGDDELETLAAARAKTVRAYILRTGKVKPERVFLTETQPGGVKTDGSKAFLQLK